MKSWITTDKKSIPLERETGDFAYLCNTRKLPFRCCHNTATAICRQIFYAMIKCIHVNNNRFIVLTSRSFCIFDFIFASFVSWCLQTNHNFSAFRVVVVWCAMRSRSFCCCCSQSFGFFLHFFNRAPTHVSTKIRTDRFATRKYR